MKSAAGLLLVIAASLPARAEEAPKPQPPPENGEKSFQEFTAKWRSTAFNTKPGLKRTFGFELKGFEIPVTGTMEITAFSPGPDAIAYKRTLTVDNQDAVAEKKIALPPIIGRQQWVEPLPIAFPPRGKTEMESDVELKVGEKTLKCRKLTIKTGDDLSKPDLVTTYWLCEQENLGLVRCTMTSADGKSMDVILKSWTVEEK